MRETILGFSKVKKRLLTLGIDTLLICFSLALAFCLRVGVEGWLFRFFDVYLKSCLVAILIALPVYIRMGLYRAVLRYMGPQVSFTIFRASLIAFAGFTLVQSATGLDVPRSIPVLYWLISASLLGLSRYAARYWLLGYRLRDILLSPVAYEKISSRSQQGKPIAIYGAGSAGVQLVKVLEHSKEYRPVAFLDDNNGLKGRVVSGKPIYQPSQLNAMVMDTGVQEVLLAIPSVSRKRRTEIVKSLESFGLPIKTMPDLQDLTSGRLKIQDVQEIDIADVLGREEVKPIPELIAKHITGQVVMVTGAGGSIGSEMLRQALQRQPKAIILFEHSEYNLYAIDQELQKTIRTNGINTKVISVLGSITDPARLLDVMKTYKVDTLYHAAAYKHVPIVQYNVSQGLKNNVLGTLYTAQAAIASGVKHFVLISTDKAVRPTNVMGASKRLAEMVLQALSNERLLTFYHAEKFGLGDHDLISSKTNFSMVRFGNVLGSSGSVIPVFREQIRTGGPITVTHPDINRFFMTIPEAAQLVIQAGAMSKGGDVFVLEMGEPVKIVDLAKRMVSLSGLTIRDESNPEGDIRIMYTGLRPGEKLYEELLIGDNVTETQHPLICRAEEEMIAWADLRQVLDKINQTLEEHRYKTTSELLLRYVNGYAPSDKVVDWLYQQSLHKADVDNVA
ncbi:polysaccharide biosynthesis protein [Endozoicomonas montiporae]|uniref:Polysaccharide biosynthesis protein WbpM n=1 Tax=Endozoicomonas montiporae CL-33 TaxID=570277 RepID=A0A142BCE2_9GAMM|nr:nucleoside-diphosphate sugar epimerase/dehydratase [Endozoicomonas montiporae]AMO56418.1 polysaccharide biosynthesis protein WbpM [Endozoicomonas montiporae CL-33]